MALLKVTGPLQKELQCSCHICHMVHKKRMEMNGGFHTVISYTLIYEVCMFVPVCLRWPHMGRGHRWGGLGPLFGMARGLSVQTSRLLPLLFAALWESLTDRVWMLTLRANGKHKPNAKQTKAKQAKCSCTISVMSIFLFYLSVSLAPSLHVPWKASAAIVLI